jgi:uncharacterized protein
MTSSEVDTLAFKSFARRVMKRFGMQRAAQFLFACRRNRESMQQWLAFLNAELSPIVPADSITALAVRVVRPYMRKHFTVKERVSLLTDHYMILMRYFSKDALSGSLAQEPGMLIATLIGKSGISYRFYLGANRSKEGDISFAMYDEAGHALAKISATIGRDEYGNLLLWIGGLQGAKPPLGRDEIVRATRELYGLRPKAAVLIAAQVIAQNLSITALRAPSTEGHISQRIWGKISIKRRIHADYGGFWQEVGGVVCADAEYTLPITMPKRDVQQVKAHKRKEWLRRQTMSESLEKQIQELLQPGFLKE